MLPLTQFINIVLLNSWWERRYSENSKQVKYAIQSDLKENYKGDAARILQEAVFLDPRFKQLNFYPVMKNRYNRENESEITYESNI